uniref:glutathione S-transferase T1-like n=1 Tax=Erigeron canadensis TaxID=72917 RepID=UPI001CB8D036|nr:glutathione S-transferase T1-like [Erigeron canadensis]
MTLKVYCDRMSEPSRAVLMFCKILGIDFEECPVDVLKGQTYTPEYIAINPNSKVPAIADGEFKLYESHAILIYLCCAYPGVASQWYPSDLFERSKIHSVLDWHHTNLRRTAVGLLLNTALVALNPRPPSRQAAEEAEKLLLKSLSFIENVLLKDGRFLCGRSQPSIADISFVCEIMELELLLQEDHDRIFSPYKKVLQWVEDTKSATAPHFDDVHRDLYDQQKGYREMQQQKLEKAN